MIEIRVGELAGVAVDVGADAIVRPVGTDFAPVTPAMRRFDQAAGTSVSEQCRLLGDIPLGSAVITAGGALDAQLIVHVAVRSAMDNATRPVVRQGFTNALRRLAEWGAEVVAVAPLGTGAGNLDAETAADIMLDLLAARLGTGDGPDRVVIVAEDAYQESAFTGASTRHVGGQAGTRA